MRTQRMNRHRHRTIIVSRIWIWPSRTGRVSNICIWMATLLEPHSSLDFSVCRARLRRSDELRSATSTCACGGSLGTFRLCTVWCNSKEEFAHTNIYTPHIQFITLTPKPTKRAAPQMRHMERSHMNATRETITLHTSLTHRLPYVSFLSSNRRTNLSDDL